MKIIGINGFKRSGKGEAAAAVASLRANVRLIGFADKVKIYAARSLGYLTLSDEECITLMNEAKENWFIEAFEDDEIASTIKSITGREYLQNVGNEARRTFGEDFWVDQVLPDVGGRHTALSELYRRYPDAEILCFTDLRYPNEAERVRALGGVVWEVVRPGLESDGHDSEQPLPRDLIDFQLRNMGDLAYLKTQVALGLQETL